MRKQTKSGKKNPANVLAGRNLLYFIESIGMTREELAGLFHIETDSVNKLLNGTNAISGPYNEILLRELNCDLNFIYGGVARSDRMINEIEMMKENGSKETLRNAVFRNMRYLIDIMEYLENKQI